MEKSEKYHIEKKRNTALILTGSIDLLVSHKARIKLPFIDFF